MYDSGNECEGGDNYTMTLKVMCGSDKEILTSVDNTDFCNPIITLVTLDACPIFEVDKYSRYALENYWIFAIILGIFGLFVTFYGRKCFRAVIILFGMSITFYGIMLTFSVVHWYDDLDGVEVAALLMVYTGIAFFFALLVGYIFAKMINIGLAFFGASIGLLTGVAFFKMVIPHESTLMLLVVITTFSIGLG